MNMNRKELSLRDRVGFLEQTVHKLSERQTYVETQLAHVVEDTKHLRGVFQRLDRALEDEIKKNEARRDTWFKQSVILIIVLIILLLLLL